ncbi:MAG: ATP-binding protein [Pseudobutyrivibrio ruminis]|nr:ATP-binding protein [Pseudobutyrivibrio ruminis]
MFTNPFSPIFGGKPNIFFGRERILELFDYAMVNVGSDDRALFITGTRGSGKTALLEQLSIRAGNRGRRVIDLGPENTIAQLVHELSNYDEITKTVNPQASVDILGFGGAINVGAISKTEHIGRESLQSLLLDVCSKSKDGILVTVDEVQKVPLDDVSTLCNAFQMASRKGYDIMLAVAGLPYAYTAITRHEGCTYLRRASHEELGLFTWDEANNAFSSIFSSIKGLSVSADLIDKMNSSSYGHPYLMQLLGYHLILNINRHSDEKKHVVTIEEIDEATSVSLIAYNEHALRPIIDELPNSETEYLIKMSQCLDEDRLASTADIAKSLKTNQNKLSRTRAYLINNGIIASPEHGKVMFCIPYLADYVKKEKNMSSVIEVARQRRV